ncbi:signal transduction histidine kinase, nitrogen specific, NtrB [Desulfofarcimen acetoxidans DSM 771]|uniref:histidine kinase n=1 Tax=Desulfofarcimen acetoxidans (strain ATCC 49208 / DSM 771 / KCTC 5769 / VKM B-1644 / 5575) TaxID=485916 RepID=C8W2P8_DESAS|nr:PAS domain S-box protein [Desulfofarcimen acetoxidans]ACV61054.1 signal transduction histidine kinase, nitrogen specific, NtrB [Desulfofarcimen acetoxidans DSM 771]
MMSAIKENDSEKTREQLLNELNELRHKISNQKKLHEQLSEIKSHLDKAIEINKSLAELSAKLLSPATVEDISSLILRHAQQLTSSKFGYVGYIEQSTGYLVCHTMTKDIWAICQVENKDIVFKKFGGLWGHVLKSRKSLYTNSPLQHEHSSGTPEGHIQINRFLSAPAIINGLLVGQIALANSERDYTKQDLAIVERLAGLYAIAVQRKQAEDILSLSEEKFFKAFHASPCLMSISKLSNSTYLDVNEYFLDITGHTRDEVIGHTLLEIEIWLNPEERENIINRLYRHEKVRNQEVMLRTKSGEILEVLLSAEIIKVSGEHFFLIAASDITEYKRLGENLQESEARYRMLFNKGNDSIFVHEIINQGIMSKFMEVNDIACHTLGYSREELLQLTPYDLRPDSESNSYQDISQKLLSEKNAIFERIHLTRDGKKIPVEVSSHAFEYRGKSMVLSIARDITERKQMEREMDRFSRLNLVAELAAGIGHEIRNPLTTVRGFLQMLRSKKNAQYMEYYDLMIEELDRANSIISEFLSLARNKPLDLHKQNLKQIIINISPLIQAEAIISDKNIKLELEDIPELLLDKKEIHQLILNLVLNAIEAMFPGGTITIKTYTANDKVVLAIKDEGQGIKPNILEKIGTPFFTTKENGTGLGLSMCHSIAGRHNATIKYESGINGTTVLVEFIPVI